MRMSHMVADTEEELHAMAAAIGVGRVHYQSDHYDVCLSKRAGAVRRGAVEITMRQLGAMRIFRRRYGRLPTPEEAERWWAERLAAQAPGAGGRGA